MCSTASRLALNLGTVFVQFLVNERSNALANSLLKIGLRPPLSKEAMHEDLWQDRDRRNIEPESEVGWKIPALLVVVPIQFRNDGRLHMTIPENDHKRCQRFCLNYTPYPLTQLRELETLLLGIGYAWQRLRCAVAFCAWFTECFQQVYQRLVAAW